MDELDKDKLLQCIKNIYHILNYFNYENDQHKVCGFNHICQIVDGLDDGISDDMYKFFEWRIA